MSRRQMDLHQDATLLFADEVLRGEDHGQWLAIEDFCMQRRQIPCRGCGEHRIFHDADLLLFDSMECIRFCPRCKDRLDAEDAARAGLLQ